MISVSHTKKSLGKREKEPIVLNELEIAERLAKLNLGWKIEEDKLSRSFVFENYDEVCIFFNKLSAIAKKLNHHPEVLISYNKAAVDIKTHEANALTGLDFELAEEIDELV